MNLNLANLLLQCARRRIKVQFVPNGENIEIVATYFFLESDHETKRLISLDRVSKYCGPSGFSSFVQFKPNDVPN